MAAFSGYCYMPLVRAMSNNSTPFIHTFAQHQNYYLYDVNTDTIINIPFDIYTYFEQIEKGCSIPYVENVDTLSYIETLKENGFLKTNRTVITKHPMTDVLEDCICNKISHIILQVTQKCNLRCSYCVYSGEYAHRTHSQKQMSFETACKAIDYLINHSRDSRQLAISFYGGEPLLNIELIRKCVEYADKIAEGRQIKYAMTTNGTLLSDEIVNYLIEHEFAITVSVDGPEHIHDKNRRFAGSGKGSFETMIQNVRRIKEQYPEYYSSGNIIFNGVLDPSTSFRSTNEFVISNDIFEDVLYSTNGIDRRYTDRTIIASEEFYIEKEYELFKLFLKKLGWLKQAKVSQLLDIDFKQIQFKRAGKHNPSQEHLPEKGHRGGPCVPGMLRLFVSADGVMYPCERVSELSKVAEIGDVDRGIDVDKADRILNVERETEFKCRNCWAYLYCTACVKDLDGINELSSDSLKCADIIYDVTETFKDYCALKELGYDFELDLDSIAQMTNY